MGREYEPTVGQWYDDLENDETFQVLKVDEDQEPIHIQHLDGDTEDLDVDDWAELDLELTEEPEGWSGSKAEKDDDDEDEDEDWDEDEDEFTPVKDAGGATIAVRYLNHIPTIMAGEHVIPGAYGERIDHYAVLHTIEDFYGLPTLTAADAAAPIITDAFRAH